MSLGPDNTVCKTAFVDAMTPIAGDSVKNDKVQANLGALGLAVYTIATKDADTVSNATSDAAFWQWVASVEDRLSKLAAWQQDLANALKAWQPTHPADQVFKDVVNAISDPGSLPASAPTELKGKII